MADDKKNEKKDAGSPMTSGSPEQFAADAPSHLAAQGDKAPPMPNAQPVRRYFKMHNKGGAMVQVGETKNEDGTIRPARRLVTAGQVISLDPDLAAKHPELTEVDANGKPLPKPGTDKIAARETGEASVPQKR